VFYQSGSCSEDFPDDYLLTLLDPDDIILWSKDGDDHRLCMGEVRLIKER
jgi:hypothetical protein